MKFIIGEKQEMTQIWKDEQHIAVTKVKVEPCIVTQVKKKEKDAYEAIQLGFGVRKEKNINKPQIGHCKGLGNFKKLREFRVEEAKIERGDKLDVSSFEAGDKIQVESVSKGKGFQGVVKRHGFAGQIKTHGNKDQHRMPGSIGATGPAHVFKGTRMGGRMGGDQVTVKNLEIVEIDLENNIFFIKGAVPGHRNSLVLISGEGEMKLVAKEELKKEKQEVKEENKNDAEVKDSKKEETKEVEAKDKIEADKKEEKK